MRNRWPPAPPKYTQSEKLALNQRKENSTQLATNQAHPFGLQTMMQRNKGNDDLVHGSNGRGIRPQNGLEEKSRAKENSVVQAASLATHVAQHPQEQNTIQFDCFVGKQT